MDRDEIAATLGAISGGADDHSGNPAFFVHGTDVLKLINQINDGPSAREAAMEIFLFLYMAVLDLYRKSMYVHRATRRYLSPHTHFSQDDLRLLRLIALNHEQVDQVKPRRRVIDGANVQLDEADRRRTLYAVAEVLERQVHQLWSDHQEDWHYFMERISGIQLTRPVEPEALDEQVERRSTLAVVQDLEPTDLEAKVRWHRRRATDQGTADDVDHLAERGFCGRAAQPRRVSDDPTRDFRQNGERRSVIVVVTS